MTNALHPASQAGIAGKFAKPDINTTFTLQAGTGGHVLPRNLYGPLARFTGGAEPAGNAVGLRVTGGPDPVPTSTRITGGPDPLPTQSSAPTPYSNVFSHLLPSKAFEDHPPPQFPSGTANFWNWLHSLGIGNSPHPLAATSASRTQAIAKLSDTPGSGDTPNLPPGLWW